jgi:hypothetical protein
VNIFLGIPSAGAPAKPFLESLGKLQIPAAATSIERAVITGNYVPAQRDLIVERALSARADVLVMVDDDMVLPPDALVRLCALLDERPSAGLAGALYYSRDGFRPMAVDAWHAHDTRTASIPGFETEPVAVDGVGFGCVVLRMSALTAFEPPYFAAHVFLERGAGRVRVCNEDYLFCERLRQAGWETLLAPAVRCGHYDRASGRIAPERWEPPEITQHARVAALVDGVPTLLPRTEIAGAIAETHVAAALEYVIVP